MDLVKDKISLLAPLTKHSQWKAMGLKYFNPRDRSFFASLFKQAYVAKNEEQAMNCVSQILT